MIPAALPASVHALDIPPELTGGWRTLNPSIAVHKGGLLCYVRLDEPIALGSLHRRSHVLGRLDPDRWTLRDVRRGPDHDVEDLRLVSVCDLLLGVGVARGGPAVVVDLDDAGHLLASYPQPATVKHKNLMPTIERGAVRFVAIVDPPVVLSYDVEIGECSPAVATLPPLADGRPRGGSQLVQREDGTWLAVVHDVTAGPLGELYYWHRFAVFDRELTRATLGPPWYFCEPGIEFASGLVRHGDSWVMAFGYRNREARLAFVHDATVRAFSL